MRTGASSGSISSQRQEQHFDEENRRPVRATLSLCAKSDTSSDRGSPTKQLAVATAPSRLAVGPASAMIKTSSGVAVRRRRCPSGAAHRLAFRESGTGARWRQNRFRFARDTASRPYARRSTRHRPALGSARATRPPPTVVATGARPLHAARRLASHGLAAGQRAPCSPDTWAIRRARRLRAQRNWTAGHRAQAVEGCRRRAMAALWRLAAAASPPRWLATRPSACVASSCCLAGDLAGAHGFHQRDDRLLTPPARQRRENLRSLALSATDSPSAPASGPTARLADD